MKKKYFILFFILLLTGCTSNKNLSQSENNMPAIKKILMVISPKDFRDQEYNDPKEVFSRAGAEVKVASIQGGTAIGVDGTEVSIDMAVSQVDPTQFDAVVFIGGPGMLEIINDESLQILAKKFFKEGKITAAICAASSVLAQARVLEGKNAAGWSGVRDIIEKNGAFFSDEGVVVDGKIITADGPTSAWKFGEEIVNDLG
jgi:protease I